MKAQVLRNKKGKFVASILHTNEDLNAVPLDAEFDDEGETEEIEFRLRDLLDLDKLHKRMDK